MSTIRPASSPALVNADAEPVVRYQIDDYDLPRFLQTAAAFGTDRYGYVVTPNVDHLIRFHENASFRALYADAAYVLLDSRFAAHVMRAVRGQQLPVCTGSDLTARLLSEVIAPTDRIVIVGAREDQVQAVRKRYGLTDLHHHNPPMGFVNDPAAVDACVRFVEQASPFRYCFVAVGSPQQEVLAQRLRTRGIARGLALCIGASIDFVTGRERRAPAWMQQVGLEWAFRLSQNPKRLAGRYLVRGPRFFSYMRRAQVELRPASR